MSYGFYSSQSALTEKSFILDKFLGCDFTQGDFITDYRRSPNCKNLEWGINPYMPKKRPGYAPITERLEGSAAINGIHFYVAGTTTATFVHAGTSLYILSGTGLKTFTDVTGSGQCGAGLGTFAMTNKKSRSFMFEGNLYIIGGGKYLQYDGTTLQEVKSIAYVPTVVIGRTSAGGGQNKEAVNLLSASQKYTYYVEEEEFSEDAVTATSGQTTISLTTNVTNLRNLVVYKETENGDEEVSGYTAEGTTITFSPALTSGAVYKVSYLRWSTEKDYLVDNTAGVTINHVKVNGVSTTDYTFNSTTGKITFTTAPTGIRGSEGVDNIEVKFTKSTSEASTIEACDVFDIFGGKNDTRVFLTGNPTYPNRDWYSALYDATYFPDNNYTFIGTSNSKIMGYIKQYNTQMIIKEDSAFEASIWLRQYSIDDDGNDSFPVEQGISGVGAVSKYSFGFLNGEPLFLTRKGIVGVAGTNVDYRNICQDRSEKINSSLLNHTDLSTATCAYTGTRYYLFIDGDVYLADARMAYKDDLNRAQYEWYYWDKVYAQCVAVKDDAIYFGYNGRLFRFNSVGDVDEYLDYDGTSKKTIDAYWETPRLYFGSISNKKTIPYVYCFCDETMRAKLKVTAIADEREIDLGTYDNTNFLFFNDIDFSALNLDGSADDDVKKIHAGIQRFTSIKFKITSIENQTSLGFGLKLIQANYLYLSAR